jgi:hypothetical protein
VYTNIGTYTENRVSYTCIVRVSSESHRVCLSVVKNFSGVPKEFHGISPKIVSSLCRPRLVIVYHRSLDGNQFPGSKKICGKNFGVNYVFLFIPIILHKRTQTITFCSSFLHPLYHSESASVVCSTTKRFCHTFSIYTTTVFVYRV